MNVSAALQEFAPILRARQPLAPYTLLKIGGSAEAVVEPRSAAEAAAVVQCCHKNRIALRVLGNGCNVLIRDEGFPGVVLRLCAAPFTQVTVESRRVRAGAGAALANLIAASVRHGLAGLETLVGIPGTVGGAVRRNAGERSGEIGQYVRRVEVVDSAGASQIRERDELYFDYHTSNLDDPVLLAAEFELDPDSPDTLVKRMRKAWIQRKARQPYSFQAAARIFKDPRGQQAAALIEQAGLPGTRVGGAQLSDRHANYLVVEPGSSARDVLRLIDLVRSRVQEQFQVELELDLSVW